MDSWLLVVLALTVAGLIVAVVVVGLVQGTLDLTGVATALGGVLSGLVVILARRPPPGGGDG